MISSPVFQKRSRLFYKYLLVILPLLTLSILVTSGVMLFSAYSNIRKTIDENYRNILKSSTGEIRSFMINARRQIESLAMVISATKPMPWQEEIAVSAFILNNPQYISISLIAVSGKRLFTTGAGAAINYTEREEFKTALKGKSGMSGVLITEGEIPFVYLAVPIFQRADVAEVLWAELDLKAIWDVLEGITIGRTGQVYIMDFSGRYLAHPEIGLVVAPPPPGKSEIAQKLSQSQKPIGWIETENQIDYFHLGTFVPDLEWAIVLRQAKSEIFAYLHRNIYWTLMLTAVMCLAAAFAGWLMAKKVVAPIRALHEQVQDISQGSLDHKVTIVSSDEIGELGVAFNEMIDSLKIYIDREVETAKELVHAKNLALLGEASSKVTHEVGNLLTVLEMVLDGLKAEQLSLSGQELLEALDKDTKRVQSFIEQFLQFAKKPQLTLIDTPLEPFLAEIMGAFEARATQKKITLKVDWAPHIPLVPIDQRWMYQVFLNLVKNSIEAMTDGGAITIKARLEKTHLLIAVQDSGIGIAPEVQEQIFDPFFTTKGKNGTGLGLPIVKSVVEAHGGAITCDSTPGEGTVFKIKLPLSPYRFSR